MKRKDTALADDKKLTDEVLLLLKEKLAEMAEVGGAIDGMTPGQTWAINDLVEQGVCLNDMVSDEQQEYFNRLISETEEGARDKFERDISDLDDPSAIVNSAYDESKPAFLRLSLQQAMRETFDEQFPGLRPSGVDDEGGEVYLLSDIAESLGANEQDLLDHAEKAGIADQVRSSTVPPNTLH